MDQQRQTIRTDSVASKLKTQPFVQYILENYVIYFVNCLGFDKYYIECKFENGQVHVTGKRSTKIDDCIVEPDGHQRSMVINDRGCLILENSIDIKFPISEEVDLSKTPTKNVEGGICTITFFRKPKVDNKNVKFSI
jgi:hypothetical protein